jgi:serine/threonine-protein kinase RsbW
VRILELRTDSRPESLGAARRQVRDAVANAGLALEAARNLEVAAGEVLANIHQHAYRNRSGPVSVEVVAAPDAVTVVVRDEGQATTPPAIPSALPSGSTGGGRGLYLVERLVDEVAIAVNPGGHGLTVRVTAHLQRGVRAQAGGSQAVDSRPAPLCTVRCCGRERRGPIRDSEEGDGVIAASRRRAGTRLHLAGGTMR